MDDTMMRHRLGRTRLWVLRTVSGAAALLGLLVAGCSPDMPLPDQVVVDDADEIDCDELTYENFGQAFFQSYCLRCHSVTNVGDIARNDAPVGIDYDTLEGVREFATRIRLRAGELGDMPPLLVPVPRPSEEERLQLIRWIDCDTPSETDPADGP